MSNQRLIISLITFQARERKYECQIITFDNEPAYYFHVSVEFEPYIGFLLLLLLRSPVDLWGLPFWMRFLRM